MSSRDWVNNMLFGGQHEAIIQRIEKQDKELEQYRNKGVTMNRVLNILAWVVFVLSIISYISDNLGLECIYLGIAAIFLVVAPRTYRWDKRD